MKRSDLQQLVGRNFGFWEIESAEYDNVEKVVKLSLKEFSWYEKAGCDDFKKYSGQTKEVKILDKYAFTYLEDGKLTEAVKVKVEKNKGIYWSSVQELNSAITAPAYSVTTKIQNEWNRFLRELDDFNEDEYTEIFNREYGKHLIDFHTKQGNIDVLNKYVDCFANLGKELEKTKGLD